MNSVDELVNRLDDQQIKCLKWYNIHDPNYTNGEKIAQTPIGLNKGKLSRIIFVCKSCFEKDLDEWEEKSNKVYKKTMENKNFI